MSKNTEAVYSVTLRQDQCDLIVMAMEHIRGLTLGAGPEHSVDRLGRIFLKRCCVEIVDDIRAQVPASKP